MSIYSIFLDKDNYYNKKCKLNIKAGSNPGIKQFNNLAEFIKIYLETNQEVEYIYIAGACYSKSEQTAEELVKTCFGDKNKKDKGHSIATISKYNRYSYTFTVDAIKKFQNFFKTDVKKNSDHRKMMYFLRVGNNETTQTDKEEFPNFEVVAVLIGSSNFSNNAYLKNSASEADVFFVQDGKETGNEAFISGLIEYEGEEILMSKTLKNNDGFFQKIFDSNIRQLDDVNREIQE